MKLRYLTFLLLSLLATAAQAAVTIITQPQAVTKLAGDLAVFTVQATGTGTLTYQWRKDGSDIPGATQQALVLNPVTAGDAATYSVVVSDAAPSSATSSGAALTVRVAVPGDVDFSFAGGSSISSPIYAVAMQTDGKVVIGGGFTAVNGAVRGRIARLNADGSTDYTFGNGLSGANGNVYDVAVQADGKVILAGDFTLANGTARNRIARLNSDGTLDTSFSDGLSGADSSILAVRVQSDGKLVIGGLFTTVNGTARGGIARLNSDGTLDASFGNTLEALLDVEAVTLQSDGKVVIGGFFFNVNGTARSCIARLNTDGTLDSSFGNGLAGADNAVNAVAIQSDGEVLIGGTFATVNGTARNGVARLNSDGTLDSSFGDGLSGTSHTVRELAVQSDGKVVIGGFFTTVNGMARGRIARLNSDGTLDNEFGTGLAGADAAVYAVVRQDDGKVLIGGLFTTVNGTARNWLARLNSDGTLDTGYGNGTAGANSNVVAVAVQSDGKVVIGGFFTTVNGTTRNRIARLNGDGTLDNSFGNGLDGADGTVYAVAVQSDGKVVIAGDFITVNGLVRFRIARLNSDGTVDTSFGTGQNAPNLYVKAVAVQSDGTMLIGGRFTTVNGTARGRIARLNSNGALDTGFGNGLAGANNTVSAVTVQSDGKVLIGGDFTTANGTARGRIARLNSDGTLDTSFGNGLAGMNGSVAAVVVQSDGKVLIGGDFATANGTARNSIARLNSDGTLDPSFGNGLAGANGAVLAMAVQSDGKVVIGGFFTTVNGTARTRIARLNSNGTLDTSFGNGLPGTNNTVNAVVVQSDGKVLIGGAFSAVNGTPRSGYARLVGSVPPTATAPTSASVTTSVATLGGNVTSDGGATVTGRGVVYARTAVNGDPVIGGTGVTQVTATGTTGVFTMNTTGSLSAHTPYTFKAYATNSVGTSYTSAATFTTLNTPPIGPDASTTGTTGDQQTITVTFPTTDADGDAVALTNAASGPGVTVNSFTGTSVTFTPNAIFTGNGSFTYTVGDGFGGTATGTIAVTVTDNDPPVVTPPGNITVHATSPAGAVVSFTPTASDAVGVASLTSVPASGSTFPAGMTTTVTVTARDAANNAGTGQFTVTVTPLTAAEAWRYAAFGTAANTGAAADGADPDGDGLINAVELAFGTDPNGASSGPAMLDYGGTFAGNGTILSRGSPRVMCAATPDGRDIRVLYVRRADAAALGLSYTVELSDSLGAWAPSGATPVVLADDGVWQIVSVPLPSWGGEGHYARLRVSLAP